MRTVQHKAIYVIIAAALIKLIMQLVATAHSGFHGDELLHIEAGKHLAWGYMDFPPLIGLLSWIQGIFQSDSLYIHHIFNYLSSILIVILLGLVVIRLKGGVVALILAEAALLFSPGFAASQYLFLPTAFEQLFVLTFIYLSILYCDKREARYLYAMALVAALGILNKYSMAIFLAGFVIATLIHDRRVLFTKHSWLAFILFIAIISPNLIWQTTHDLPVFHHMSALYKTQLNDRSIFNELTTLIIFLNPISVVIWVTALFFVPFQVRFKPYRLAAMSLICSFVFLLFSKGKSYYYFPVILGLIAFGAVFLEQILSGRKLTLGIYLVLLVGVGAYLLPHGVPVFTLNRYLAAYNLMPNSDNRIPLVFENYYSQENWPRILSDLSEASLKLSPEERRHCYIWGRHYSMAGGVNLLGPRYDLPKAFSFHSSLYSWVPDFGKDVVVLAISEANLGTAYWKLYFDEVEQFSAIQNYHAPEKNWYSYQVFICRKSKYDSNKLKELFRDQIF